MQIDEQSNKFKVFIGQAVEEMIKEATAKEAKEKAE